MPGGGFQSVIIAAHVHDTLSTRRACGAQMSSSNLHRKTPQGAHPPDGEVTVQTGQVTAQGGTAVWEPRCLPLPSRRKSSPLLRDTVLVSHRPAGGPSSQSPSGHTDQGSAQRDAHSRSPSRTGLWAAQDSGLL